MCSKLASDHENTVVKQGNDDIHVHKEKDVRPDGVSLAMFAR